MLRGKNAYKPISLGKIRPSVIRTKDSLAAGSPPLAAATGAIVCGVAQHEPVLRSLLLLLFDARGAVPPMANLRDIDALSRDLLFYPGRTTNCYLSVSIFCPVPSFSSPPLARFLFSRLERW